MPKITSGKPVEIVTRLYITEKDGRPITMYLLKSSSVTQEKLNELEKIKNDNFILYNLDNFVKRNFEELSYNNIFIEVENE